MDLLTTKVVAMHPEAEPWFPVALTSEDRKQLADLLPSLPSLHGNMTKEEREAFPAHALSPKLKAAAEFIHLTNQSPIGMCACSVISAASLVCQGIMNVHWRPKIHSPVSLIVIVEAESGERKSSNDEIAFREIRRFDAEQAAFAKTEEAIYVQQLKIWKVKVKAAEKALCRQALAGESTLGTEGELMELERNRPVKRKRAQMLLANSTRQALARHLGTIYPFVGIISDEAAVVLSSDALGDLGMLNKVWDGGTWTSDRITRERIELRNTRLAILLQVQPGVSSDFLDSPRSQVHATGFSSRCFFVRPESLQGTRLHRFIDIPSDGMEAFDEAIRSLLKRYEGPEPPQPVSVDLGEAATELLAWFQEKVEIELGDGRRFCMMRGNASKSVEQCSRLAAVMHGLEGYAGPISVDVMRGAIQLTAWFLNQYRMRFCPLSQPELDALELEDCISRHAHKFKKTQSVAGPELCRLAPRRLRQVEALKATLRTLEAQGKLKIWDGHSWHVSLTWWFPPQDPPWKQVEESRSIFALRWRQQPPAATSREIPVETGHVLWPGVILP